MGMVLMTWVLTYLAGKYSTGSCIVDVMCTYLSNGKRMTLSTLIKSSRQILAASRTSVKRIMFSKLMIEGSGMIYFYLNELRFKTQMLDFPQRSEIRCKLDPFCQ